MTDAPTVFGIDLGTTYSAVAYVDEHDQPVILLNQENSAVTPSVVFFESLDNVLVGVSAREAGRLDPDNYVELVKRDMGNPHFARQIHGREFRPEAISAYILRKLKTDAEAKLGRPVTDAVITVPAYFNEAERKATEQAGTIAGLTVRGIIPEPTAAAIAYAAVDSGDQTILVYDLGGGTFDVTVMQVSGGRVRVVCIDGDHKLGGRDWDTQVVHHLAAGWQAGTNSTDDPFDDKETLQELYKQAEDAKQALSRQGATRVKVSHAGKFTRVDLTREQFDALTADKLVKTITLTRQAMAEAKKLGVTRIDKILLVGGSSYMPQVQERLAAEFPGIEQKLFEPEQAVAKGAAIYASRKQIQDAYKEALEKFFAENPDRAPEVGAAPNLDNALDGVTMADAGGIDFNTLAPDIQAAVDKKVKIRLPGRSDDALAAARTMTVVNACSKSFGIEAIDENDRPMVAYLIRRNTAVPATNEQEFYTRHAGQTEVSIKVYESPMADPPDEPGTLTPIKTANLDLPPGLPVNHPIRVRFSLSDDGGQLRVQATDPASGRSIDVSVDAMDALMPQDLDALARQVAGATINR